MTHFMGILWETSGITVSHFTCIFMSELSKIHSDEINEQGEKSSFI